MHSHGAQARRAVPADGWDVGTSIQNAGTFDFKGVSDLDIASLSRPAIGVGRWRKILAKHHASLVEAVEAIFSHKHSGHSNDFTL
ncbi:hypothetical protein D3C72_2364190 [compost metagenome]